MTLCQRNNHRRTKSHVQLDRENPKSTEEMIIKVIIIIFSVQHKLYHGEQGWHSGESAGLPPMCPGFDSRTRCHTWAEFVGSLLCSERFFSGNSGFPLSSKTNI